MINKLIKKEKDNTLLRENRYTNTIILSIKNL